MSKVRKNVCIWWGFQFPLSMIHCPGKSTYFLRWRSFQLSLISASKMLSLTDWVLWLLSQATIICQGWLHSILLSMLRLCAVMLSTLPMLVVVLPFWQSEAGWSTSSFVGQVSVTQGVVRRVEGEIVLPFWWQVAVWQGYWEIKWVFPLFLCQ